MAPQLPDREDPLENFDELKFCRELVAANRSHIRFTTEPKSMMQTNFASTKCISCSLRVRSEQL
jgi:hypothetical protein